MRKYIRRNFLKGLGALSLLCALTSGLHANNLGMGSLNQSVVPGSTSILTSQNPNARLESGLSSSNLGKSYLNQSRARNTGNAQPAADRQEPHASALRVTGESNSSIHGVNAVDQIEQLKHATQIPGVQLATNLITRLTYASDSSETLKGLLEPITNSENYKLLNKECSTLSKALEQQGEKIMQRLNNLIKPMGNVLEYLDIVTTQHNDPATGENDYENMSNCLTRICSTLTDNRLIDEENNKSVNRPLSALEMAQDLVLHIQSIDDEELLVDLRPLISSSDYRDLMKEYADLSNMLQLENASVSKMLQSLSPEFEQVRGKSLDLDGHDKATYESLVAFLGETNSEALVSYTPAYQEAINFVINLESRSGRRYHKAINPITNSSTYRQLKQECVSINDMILEYSAKIGALCCELAPYISEFMSSNPKVDDQGTNLFKEMNSFDDAIQRSTVPYIQAAQNLVYLLENQFENQAKYDTNLKDIKLDLEIITTSDPYIAIKEGLESLNGDLESYNSIIQDELSGLGGAIKKVEKSVRSTLEQ